MHQAPRPLLENAARLLEQAGFAARFSCRPSGRTLSVRVVPGANWRIDVAVDPDCLKRLPFEDAWKALQALCLQEMAHWSLCPFDADGARAITQGVIDAIKGLGDVPTVDDAGVLRDESPFSEFAKRLADMFMDAVVWADLVRKDGSAAAAHGLAHYWKVQLESSKTASLEDLASAGLLAALTDPGVGSGLAEACCRHPSWGGVQAAVAAARTQLTDPMPPAGSPGWLTSWRARAAAFARAVAPVLAGPARSHTRHPPRPRARRQGGEPASNLRDVEFLDQLYQKRAWSAEVAVSARGSEEVPVSWLGRQEVGRDRPASPARIDLSSTLVVRDVDGRRRLRLFERDRPVMRSFGTRGASGPVPPMLFVVDDSKSMEWDALAGRGSYDAVLRSIYGVWRYLRERRLADRSTHGIVSFSRTTIFSGWHTWHDLQPLKRQLFGHRNADETVLDWKTLRHAVDIALRNCVVFLITDGDIRNRTTIVRSFPQLAAAGHHPVLIEIAPSPGPLYYGLRSDPRVDAHSVSESGAIGHLVLGRVARLVRSL